MNSYEIAADAAQNLRTTFQLVYGISVPLDELTAYFKAIIEKAYTKGYDNGYEAGYGVSPRDWHSLPHRAAQASEPDEQAVGARELLVWAKTFISAREHQRFNQYGLIARGFQAAIQKIEGESAA